MTLFSPENNTIGLQIMPKNNERKLKIGQNGILTFITNYNDNERNILNDSEMIQFETTMRERNEESNEVKCKLWKPQNDYIRIFCNLNKILTTGEHSIQLNQINFDYNNYQFIIYQDQYYFITIEQINMTLPFLYSDKQIININDKEENYILKFKYESYDKEILFLTGNNFEKKIINRCNKNIKEIECNIKKDDLLEMLSYNGKIFSLGYYNFKIEPMNFINILDIIINIDNYQKENVYVEITKLLENTVELNNFFAYETNVTDISNIIIKQFSYNNLSTDFCFLRKYPEKPLIFMCLAQIEGIYSLDEIKE